MTTTYVEVLAFLHNIIIQDYNNKRYGCQTKPTGSARTRNQGLKQKVRRLASCCEKDESRVSRVDCLGENSVSSLQALLHPGNIPGVTGGLDRRE